MGGVKMSVHSLPNPSLHYLPWEMRKIWTSCHKIFETSAVENPFLLLSFCLWFSFCTPLPHSIIFLIFYMSYLKVFLWRLYSLHSSFPFPFFLFPLSSYNVTYLIQQIGIILRSCFMIYPFLIFNAKYENVHMNLTK